MATVSLDLETPIWERFFAVFPLVLVGSREPDGSFDLAPKHLAIPASWQHYFAFVCAPRHATYRNIKRHGEFTVSYPKPHQIVETSLAADPRAADASKPALRFLPTFPAQKVEGVFIEGGYLFLECRLHRIVDDLGDNSLIIGRIVAAQVDEAYLRASERDDQELIREAPLLAYLHPGRFTQIEQSFAFPFPRGFKR
ncbi:MAG TPA: flavin reductase [Methylothermaceae bacterium]|nr:flavin reductase [Methylothermaceae bacterium]